MLRLIGLLLILVGCHALHAQNVFNPADVLVQYDSTTPAGSAANPAKPAEFVMSKWIRTPRVAWNTSNFKSYTWRGMSFRLRFPNNYNPANADKYPVIVFFHGGGEIGSIYDNEFQLLLGAQLFEERINKGEWNGFLLFPQQTAIGWDDYYFSRVNGVLDTLQKYNAADPDRVISMGLSLGGYGAVAYGSFYPRRVAAMLPASPAQIRTLSGSINSYKHIPIWLAHGGLDANPDPPNAQAFNKDVREAGGDIYQTYYANTGHDTWNFMWNQVNASNNIILTDYWNKAHKAQPLLFFQQQQFCAGAPIAARMGISAGYAAYEWDKNGVTIPGATNNEYVATSVGQYRVRFRREATGGWSLWTPHPVVISAKSCAGDTLFAEHFNADNFFVANGSYTIGNYGCQGGIVTSGTDQITQDATSVQGKRFLVNYTYAAGGGCIYAVNDRVWNTAKPVTVSPNTTYEYSFYLGNLNGVSPAKLVPTINGVPITDSAVSSTGSGNGSWKRFSFTWNSGNATSADLGIINRSNETTGNDFAIDEICFKPAAATPVPACIVNTQPLNGATLSSQNTAVLSWSSAPTAVSYDLFIWTGDSIPSTPKATVTGITYTVTGLSAGTTYKWYVVPKNAFGSAGNCSTSATSFATASLPFPACAVNTSPANGDTVVDSTIATLGWSASSTAISYDVYIWTGDSIPKTPKSNTTGTTYTATGLSAGANYKWYIAPRNSIGAATTCAATNTSSFITAGGTVPAAKGEGLKGDYYNNPNLAGNFALTRTDSAVNFDWRGNSPSALIDRRTFSVRWTGRVMPTHTELYTFYAQCDEGVRLWINGQLLVDNWKAATPEASGSIELNAGIKYDLLMEYYEKKGNGVAKLLWSSASTPKAIIPVQQLFLPPAIAIKRPAGKIKLPFTGVRVAVELLDGKSIVNSIRAFPNPSPAGQDITLQFTAGRSGYASIQMTNGSGTVVQQVQVIAINGSNTRILHTTGLRPGIYIIQVSDAAGNLVTQKLIIN